MPPFVWGIIATATDTTTTTAIALAAAMPPTTGVARRLVGRRHTDSYFSYKPLIFVQRYERQTAAPRS